MKSPFSPIISLVWNGEISITTHELWSPLKKILWNPIKIDEICIVYSHGNLLWNLHLYSPVRRRRAFEVLQLRCLDLDPLGQAFVKGGAVVQIEQSRALLNTSQGISLIECVCIYIYYITIYGIWVLKLDMTCMFFLIIAFNCVVIYLMWHIWYIRLYV